MSKSGAPTCLWATSTMIWIGDRGYDGLGDYNLDNDSGFWRIAGD
jgi:hypothetical protein